MNKKAITLIFLFFLFSISIYAVKPEQASADYLTVIYPKFEYYTARIPIRLHYHVYNSTGLLKTANQADPTECNIHIYEVDGGHMVEATLTMDSNNVDYQYILNDTSRQGTYGVLVGCNNSLEGGFVSYSFEVTPNARPFSVYYTFLVIGGYFILMFLFLYFMHVFKEDGASSLVYGIMGGTLSLFMVMFSLAFKPVQGTFSYWLTAFFASIALYFFVIGYAFYSDYKKESKEEN